MMSSRIMSLVLVALAAMAAKAEAGEPIVQPPYSWRGIEGTGGFSAKDLVTGFCDYPAEMAEDPVVSKVVRVSDGKKLDMIRLPLPAGAEKQKKDDDADAADDAKPDSNGPSSTYNSWTAWKDVLYCEHMEGWVYAIRLALEGGALKQEVIWRSSEDGDNRDPNLVYHNGRLYCGPFSKGGWAALDAATGRGLAAGPRPQGYSTSLGVGDGKVVMRSSGWASIAARYTTYSIVSLADLKSLGSGLLVQPKPEGEVAARHIGFLGTPYIAWGVGGITCWGNRIFIRSNDYLWCIGDPAKQFAPPEAAMK